MSEVKRYDFTFGYRYDNDIRPSSWAEESDAGEFVLAADYDALTGELTRAHTSFAEAMEVERGKFAAKIKELYGMLEQVQHELQKGRVWNGMGWTYIGLHLIYQTRALSIIEDAIVGQQKESGDE